MRSVRDAGQIALITILVLAVGATVALSLIARTTIDTSISSQVEESSRAFSAAEAGVEQALQSGQGGTQIVANGVTYNATVATVGGNAAVYQLPSKTPEGSTETVWFVNHNADGSINEAVTFTGASLDICWSYEQPVQPAIAMGILYKAASDGSYRVARDAFDPDSGRANTNHFTVIPSPPSGGCGQSNYYRRTINFAAYGINPAADILLALRLRPVYVQTQFAFDPGSFTIPLQGSQIVSTGTTQTGVTRKVVVNKSYASAPTLFDATVFSESAFSH
ncbi:hypothetical protein HY031_01470 [Candidatus Gottesmanbacteria bacterium]|nr:hypothetical protein [Candidatus Gottesmanbacteria bacterium]